MELWTRNAADMYASMMVTMSTEGVREESRNGQVLSLPTPILVHVQRPWERVVLDPVRNCNPFFHVAEIMWMMAGEAEVTWISQFNKRFTEYADEGGIVHGAYGDRWRYWFAETDQLHRAVQLLKANPQDRRVVLGMWDPEHDLGVDYKDVPCNTHIYLRVQDGFLNMMVCNRSNDVIWGMTGANIVHMTALHELLAKAIGVPQGRYSVVTMNAHVYTDLPQLDEMLATRTPYECSTRTVLPLMAGSTFEQFLEDCHEVATGRFGMVSSPWIRGVAVPMLEAYLDKSCKEVKVLCPQWQEAASNWLYRNRR